MPLLKLHKQITMFIDTNNFLSYQIMLSLYCFTPIDHDACLHSTFPKPAWETLYLHIQHFHNFLVGSKTCTSTLKVHPAYHGAALKTKHDSATGSQVSSGVISIEDVSTSTRKDSIYA